MNTARVGDIAEQIRGVTYSKGEATAEPGPDSVALLRAGNITDSGIDLSDLTYVPRSRVSERQQIMQDDVLIAASSGSLSVVGKSARVTSPLEATFGAFCKVLRPRTGVHPGYFAHYFRTPEYRRYISSVAAGANINNLRADDLDRIELPLPPLPEQRRIAAILDEADALVATVRRQVLRIDEAEDRLFDATLGISQAKRTLTLADIATDFRYGTSARAGGTGFPVLRIPNVTGRAIDINDLKTVDLADSERNRLELTDRDVLFVRSNGNPKLVGRAAAFESLPAALRGEAPWVFASYLIRARLAPHISSRAVVAAARSRVGRQHLVGAAATSAGQYNISIPVLKNLPMFDPNGGAQSKFDEASQSLTTQRALLDRRLESLVALAASLRHRAFRGELD